VDTRAFSRARAGTSGTDGSDDVTPDLLAHASVAKARVDVAREAIREARERLRTDPTSDPAPLTALMEELRDAHEDLRAARDLLRESRQRARPLSPDDRREAILDAVIPLLKAGGRDVSTRQMAESACVAEGTLFRAFGDKESIIHAAVERVMDPEPLRNALRGIDPDEPTEEKVDQVLRLLRERFEGVIGFMTALRIHPPPKPAHRPDDDSWIEILDQTFRDGELAVSSETFGFYIRLLAFGAAVPIFNAPHPFTTDELTALILRGVLPPTSERTP
jgi:AcrR family transcriptional regulator